MRLQMFCVRDRATEAFGNVMFLVSRGQAVRGFSDEINRAADDNNLYRHSEDFDLYYLGEFDTDTAEFATVARPEKVVEGRSCKLNGGVK